MTLMQDELRKWLSHANLKFLHFCFGKSKQSLQPAAGRPYRSHFWTRKS